MLRHGQIFELALTLGLTACLVGLSAGPEAYSRFRLPAMPFVAILAGHGLAYRGATRPALTSLTNRRTSPAH